MRYFTSVSSATRIATRSAFPSVAQFMQLLLVVVACAAPSAFAQDRGPAIETKQTLEVGQYLTSLNKKYKLVMQSDGNLVLYLLPVLGTPGNVAPSYLWGTGATSGRRAVLQSDGNLCLYPAGGGAGSWCNYSNGPEGAYYLMLRDSGNLEIYRGTLSNFATSVLVWTAALDTNYYSDRYPDLKSVFGKDARKLMEHWVSYGRFEGRALNNSVSDAGRQKAMEAKLDTRFYANKYADLRNAFGYDAEALFQHWKNHGMKEGRVPNQATDAWRAIPPRSAHRQSSMRTVDWLHTGEFLLSPNGFHYAILQSDNNLAVYRYINHTDPSKGHANVWHWNVNHGAGKTSILRMQSDGHFCAYAYDQKTGKQGQGIKCKPADAGGPPGPYFLTLQNDGNLVIIKGNGFDDHRGWLWGSTNESRNSAFNFGAVAESVGSWVVDAANTVANGTAGAANTVATGGSAAAVLFHQEVKNAVNAITDLFGGKLTYTLSSNVLEKDGSSAMLEMSGKLPHGRPMQQNLGSSGFLRVALVDGPTPGPSSNSGTTRWRLSPDSEGPVVLRISNPINEIDIAITVKPECRYPC